MHRNRKFAPVAALTPGLIAAAATVGVLGAVARPAHAWKPKTHVYLAEQALTDALDNDKVTIYETDYRTGKIVGVLGEFPVDSQIVAALRAAPEQYRAGVLGPDAYPDILTGQQIVHPEESHQIDGTAGGTNAWMSHLWGRAFGTPQSPQVRAFTLGYLTHAAGDVFAHTYVNHFSGGEFMLIPDPTNAIKHLVLEGYIGKRTPTTFDARGARVTQDDCSIAGVEDFIYRELTYATPGSVLETHLLKGDGTTRSLPFIFSTLRNGLQKQVDDYERIRLSKRGPERLAWAAAKGPAAEYKKAWIKDIDAGLKAWPAVSHEIAKALVYNENGSDLTRAREVMNQYVRDHLASMAGAPDAAVATAAFISDVLYAILPQATRDAFKELMKAPLNYIAKGVSGRDLDQWVDYLKNPETHFDPIMNRPGGGHSGEVDHRIDLATFNRDHLHISDTAYRDPSQKWAIDKIPAAFNTVQMCKMMLLGPEGMKQLSAALAAKNAKMGDIPGGFQNAMLGWVRSLDAGNQWQGFPGKHGSHAPQPVFAANGGSAYQKLFLQQVGEKEWIAGGGPAPSPVTPAPVVDLSKWADEWQTTLGRVQLAQEPAGMLRGRLRIKDEYGSERDGERLELQAAGATPEALAGKAMYTGFESQVTMSLSADGNSFTGTVLYRGETQPKTWSGTRKPKTAPTQPTTPTTGGTVPVPGTTPAPAPSGPITGDGKFFPMGKFEMRLDRVEAARDGKVHAFVTFRNPTGDPQTIVNGTMKAYLEDADGMALRFNDLTRASTPQPERFANQPTLDPGVELKARFVIPALKGGGPLRSLTFGTQDRLAEGAAYDVSGVAVPGLVTREPRLNASGEWKNFGAFDVRLDNVALSRSSGGYTEIAFSLRNESDVPQCLFGQLHVQAYDADGLPIPATGIYTARGATPERINWTPWVLPGKEGRIRFLYRGPIGGKITIKDATNGQMLEFAAGK